VNERLRKLLVVGIGLLLVSPAFPVEAAATAPTGLASAPRTKVHTLGAGPVARLLLTSAGHPVTQTNVFSSESLGNSSIRAYPTAVGDLVVLSMQLHTIGITITGISGGNVASWASATAYDNTATDALHFEEWWGVANAVGPAPLTITYSSSAANNWQIELISDSFTTGSSETWSVVTGGGTSGNGTPVVWPLLTSGTARSQLYWGASEEETAGGTTTTPGFVNQLTQTPNNNCFVYGGSISPSTAYSPDCAETPPPKPWTAIGVIFAADPTPIVRSINPSAGPKAGGTLVGMTGSNLAGATGVSFGASPASFTANSDTSVTATAPAGTGTVDVTVTTPGGTSLVGRADMHLCTAHD
jgi:hypothetical protein